MYKLKVSTINKIIKICAEQMTEQNYHPDYESFEEACQKKIAKLLNIPDMFKITEE